MEQLDLEYVVEKSLARIDIWTMYLHMFLHMAAEYHVLYSSK